MDVVLEFSPICVITFIVVIWFCWIMGFGIAITDAILIALSMVPVKIVYDFFREF